MNAKFTKRGGIGFGVECILAVCTSVKRRRQDFVTGVGCHRQDYTGFERRVAEVIDRSVDGNPKSPYKNVIIFQLRYFFTPDSNTNADCIYLSLIIF